MGVPGLVWFQWLGSYRSQSESNNKDSLLAFLIGLSRSKAACVAILGVSNDVIISFPLSLSLFCYLFLFISLLFLFLSLLPFSCSCLFVFSCSFHLLIPVCFLHTERKVYVRNSNIIFFSYFNPRKKSFPTSSARKKKNKKSSGIKFNFHDRD